MNTGEKYVSLPVLTDALRAEGITINEPFVSALLAAGAPHLTHRRRVLARPSQVKIWWMNHPGFMGPNITATPAPPSP